jgi:hypothetical protein
MLYLYFERVHDSENGNEQNRAQDVTGLVKNIPTSKAARLAIALGLEISLQIWPAQKSSSNGLHVVYRTLSWHFNSLARTEVRACCSSPENVGPKVLRHPVCRTTGDVSHSCLNSLRKCKWDSTGFRNL